MPARAQGPVAANRPPFTLSLRSKLALAFGLFMVLIASATLLAFMWGVPLTPYQGRLQRELRDVEDSLSLVADLKKERLQSWLQQCRQDLRFLARNQFTIADISRLRRLALKPDSPRVDPEALVRAANHPDMDRLRQFFTSFRESFREFRSIDVVDPASGLVIFSTNARRLGTMAGQEVAVTGALSTGDSYISDVHSDQYESVIVMDFSQVVMDKGLTLAVIMGVVDAEAILRPLISTAESNLEFGEAVLVNNKMLPLVAPKSPLPDGTRLEPLKQALRTTPIRLAADGYEGFIEALDYRDVPVLAAYRHVRLSSEVGWGLVLKRDRAEVLGPLYHELTYIAAVWLLGLLLVLGCTLLLARFLVRPLRQLSMVSRKVAEGDLSVRANLVGRDEVGQVASAFNLMLARLQEFTQGLEEQVATRTAELLAANRDLQKEIGEREAAERARRKSEENYRRIVETASEGIWAVDNKLKTTFVNPKMADMLGYTPDEMVGRSLDAFIYSQDLPAYKLSMRKRSQGQSETFERRYLHKDGSPVWFFINAAPIFDEDDNYSGSFAMFTDISKRKHAEEEKAELEAQLRQAQKIQAIGTLAGGIAHDFNNILAAVLGYAELAQVRATQGHGNAKELEQIVQAATRARNLVREILAYSRRVPLESKALSLNASIGEALEMLSHTLPKMIDIQTDLAPDLALVHADPNQIQQIILNLAANAADAMPDGGRLTFATRNQTLEQSRCSRCHDMIAGSYVLLEIIDTGVGIPKEVLDRIFDPFFTTKELGKGTGLGLSSVFGIVRSHGGHIHCDSQPGQGSVFRIYLPVNEAELPPQGAAPAIVARPTGQETVLLVDDEEQLLNLGSEVLQSHGYTVLRANSGERALEVFQANRGLIDLVVMDLGMPGMGGMKCLANLMQLDPAIKVVVASGYASQDRINETLMAGAARFVPKPYHMADLLTAVREVLDRLAS